MKQTLSYLFLVLVLGFSACSTSDDNGNSRGPESDPDPEISPSGSYWPYAKGNIWSFQNVDDPKDVLDHYFYQTTVYQDQDYYLVKTSEESEEAFFEVGTRQDKGIFYAYQGAVDYPGIKVSPGVSKAIDTNLKIGESFTEEIIFTISGDSNGTLTHTNQGKILEKSPSVTIKGQTYKDVLKTQLTKTVYNSITDSDITIIEEYWLAKGVGPIYKKTTTVNLDITEVQEYELVSYTLN